MKTFPFSKSFLSFFSPCEGSQGKGKMVIPAMSDTANHASMRHQARTDGGGGEKESSVPELCSLESVCGQACAYRHIARCVFTTIFINHKYSCSGVFNFILLDSDK